MAKRAKVYAKRTDAEREQIILAFEEVPVNGRGEWLRAQGLGTGYFYRMRLKYFETHPEFTIDQPAEAPPSSSPKVLFRDLSDDQKRKALAEYDQLPRERYIPGADPDRVTPRAAWRTVHGISTTSDISRYRDKLGLRPALSTALALNGQSPKPRPDRPPKSSVPEVLTPLPAHITTLEDAINAFKVERDMLNTVIAKMERMKAGHF